MGPVATQARPAGADEPVVRLRQQRLDIAATLSSLYPVTTTILAAVILRERIGRAHAVGIVVAAIAVALIAAGAAGSG